MGWPRPLRVLSEDALGAGGAHQARVAIRLGLARPPAERCDAIETGPTAAGDEIRWRLSFGDEALVRHALERQIEHAGPDLNVPAGLLGDFLDDPQAVPLVIGERE